MLTSANDPGYDTLYMKLDILFVYYTTLVKINLKLVKHILESYTTNNWWVWVQRQMFNNKKLGRNKALLPFIIGDSQSFDSNLYYWPRPKFLNKLLSPTSYKSESLLFRADKSKLIFHLNHLIKICHLC